MRYDLYYVKHRSLWLDLRILADTVKTVLGGRESLAAAPRRERPPRASPPPAGGPEAPMKPALLDILVCPACGNALDLRADVEEGARVLEGALRCPGCARDYPIVRACRGSSDSAAYASSFGRQWHWFRQGPARLHERAPRVRAEDGRDHRLDRRGLSGPARARRGRGGRPLRGDRFRQGRRRGGRRPDRAIDAAFENIGPGATSTSSRPTSSPCRSATPPSTWRIPWGCCTTRRITPPPSRAWPPPCAGAGPRGLSLRALRAEPPFLGHDSRGDHPASFPALRALSALAVPRTTSIGCPCSAKLLGLGLPDLAPSRLAVALARHVRLVLAALPVEAPVSGGLPLVPGQWLPRRRALRRPHPHARGEEGEPAEASRGAADRASARPDRVRGPPAERECSARIPSPRRALCGVVIRRS